MFFFKQKSCYFEGYNANVLTNTSFTLMLSNMYLHKKLFHTSHYYRNWSRSHGININKFNKFYRQLTRSMRYDVCCIDITIANRNYLDIKALRNFYYTAPVFRYLIERSRLNISLWALIASNYRVPIILSSCGFIDGGHNGKTVSSPRNTSWRWCPKGHLRCCIQLMLSNRRIRRTKSIYKRGMRT